MFIHVPGDGFADEINDGTRQWILFWTAKILSLTLTKLCIYYRNLLSKITAMIAIWNDEKRKHRFRWGQLAAIHFYENFIHGLLLLESDLADWVIFSQI